MKAGRDDAQSKKLILTASLNRSKEKEPANEKVMFLVVDTAARFWCSTCFSTEQMLDLLQLRRDRNLWTAEHPGSNQIPMDRPFPRPNPLWLSMDADLWRW
jgi:hypothetical protein